MEKFYYKVHTRGADVVLAVADEDSLGKKYEGNKRVLDLISFADFYRGELADSAKIKKLFEQCTNANLVGQKACALAIEHGLAKNEHIVDIGGISHIQIYKIEGEKK